MGRRIAGGPGTPPTKPHTMRLREFNLAAALIEARSKAELTQEQVAALMQTSQAYVAKLEGSRVNPSVKTLRRFSAAIGTRLKITFEPMRKNR